MNVLDDFYLPLLDQEKTYLSKEYKLLKKNKIDTAEFEGFEKDKQGNLKYLGDLGKIKKTEDSKEKDPNVLTNLYNFGKEKIGGMFDE